MKVKIGKYFNFGYEFKLIPENEQERKQLEEIYDENYVGKPLGKAYNEGKLTQIEVGFLNNKGIDELSQ
jgi:hypothetical protein